MFSGRLLAAPPTSPSQVYANPTDSGVTLSWQPVAGATTYNVYRATVSGLTRNSTGLPGFVASIGIATTSFTANSLTNDTVHYFIVTAVNGSGESTDSPEVASTPSTTVDAAKAGVNAFMAQFSGIINAQGANLAYTHLTPLIATAHLNSGEDGVTTAKHIASDVRGATLANWTLIGVNSFDPVNQIISAVGTIDLNGSPQVLDGRSDGFAILKSDDGGTTWKMYGNQRVADVSFTIEMRTDRFPGSNTGPRQNVNFHVEAPQGTVALVTVAGPGLSVSQNLPQGTVNIVTVVGDPMQPMGETLYRDSFTFNFDPPNTIGNNAAYTFTVTQTMAAGGATLIYPIPFTGTIVTDAVNGSINIISPTGHALADATLGTSLPVNWTLPTAYTISDLNFSSFAATSTTPGMGFQCRLSEQMLSAGTTSGTVTFPTTCNGQPTVLASINLSSRGLGGERSHIIYVFSGGGGYPTAPTITSILAGNGQATVSFNSPGSNGGSAITGYTVTCDQGGHTASGPASPITVTGLGNETTYACRVAAVNATGTGTASLPVNVTPSSLISLALVAVQSRKTHGVAGTFGLNIATGIPIAGAITVEPRVVGGGHSIVFQFNAPVINAGTVAMVDGMNAPIGTATSTTAGNEVRIALANVGNGQRIKLSLTGVTGGAGPPIDVSATLGFLVGDVNGSGTVSAPDVSSVKARSGQMVTVANFVYDVGASGIVSAADIVNVKARSGTLMP